MPKRMTGSRGPPAKAAPPAWPSHCHRRWPIMIPTPVTARQLVTASRGKEPCATGAVKQASRLRPGMRLGTALQHSCRNAALPSASAMVSTARFFARAPRAPCRLPANAPSSQGDERAEPA
ncbi:hypothetical protein CO2235_U1020007 [Cupriavidus oxalaticus]|uniref:Uncharacterized protein n=1 Tax=Cupriavidus oxalaticus TaxID=96344 RepID=A0A375FJX4_9BURK|nr:hypothetical protein CO2235_U1020007 [Cupriavidus oxalaticus]